MLCRGHREGSTCELKQTQTTNLKEYCHDPPLIVSCSRLCWRCVGCFRSKGDVDAALKVEWLRQHILTRTKRKDSVGPDIILHRQD